MQTLLIDNYDSYTFNLYQLIAQVTGREPVVVTNDACSWAGIEASEFSHIVISPGPGHPARPADFGACAEIVRRTTLPTLGVCLGHQGIVHGYGGTIAAGRRPMHGVTSRIWHTGRGLFAGIPQGFEAVRYHSLVAVTPLPQELSALAWSEDGALMAVAHQYRPLWGVQFHPESIGSQCGHALIENFFGEWRGDRARPQPIAAPTHA